MALFAQEESASRDRLAALAETLDELDPDTLSPLAALNLLSDWKARFTEKPKKAPGVADEADC